MSGESAGGALEGISGGVVLQGQTELTRAAPRRCCIAAARADRVNSCCSTEVLYCKADRVNSCCYKEVLYCKADRVNSCCSTEVLYCGSKGRQS